MRQIKRVLGHRKLLVVLTKPGAPPFTINTNRLARGHFKKSRWNLYKDPPGGSIGMGLKSMLRENSRMVLNQKNVVNQLSKRLCVELFSGGIGPSPLRDSNKRGHFVTFKNGTSADRLRKKHLPTVLNGFDGTTQPPTRHWTAYGPAEFSWYEKGTSVKVDEKMLARD